MSGESVQHIRLVEALERHVRRIHAPPRGLFLLLDHDSFGRDRPHRCGGYHPDLFASDLPATFEVIGEAKTPADVARPHSQLQLRGFLNHLALRSAGHLYLCVPRFSLSRARSVIQLVRGPEHAGVRVEVIAGD